MNLMYDIEFLTAVPPVLGRHVVYFYQGKSRALRKQVRDAVLELFATQNIEAESTAPADLQSALIAPSLFTTLLVCDLEDWPPTQIKGFVATIFDELVECEQQLFLLVPGGLPPGGIVAACTIIVEPMVTAETLPMVFDFCARTSKAFDFAKLDNTDAFRKHLANVVGAGPMLLCTPPAAAAWR